MNSLDLPVEVAQPATGMAQAVLNELAEHLQRLADAGRHHVIDLTSLPMNESDKRELAKMLGTGEVNVTLTTIGDSEIYETEFSGIWWIKHYSGDHKLISELIEVTPLPDIIKSHADDIQMAANKLTNQILNEVTGD